MKPNRVVRSRRRQRDPLARGGRALQDAVPRLQQVVEACAQHLRRGHRQVRPVHRAAHRRGESLTESDPNI